MADPVFPNPRKDTVQGSLYKNYANNWQYQQVGGYVVAAVGNGKARALPVATGFTYAVQTASGVKTGSPPLMPAPRPDGTFITLDDGAGEAISCTFLNGSISLPLPSLVNQNPPQFMFTVGSRFEYLLDGVVGADTGLPGGSYPSDFPVVQVSQKQIPGAQEVPAIDLFVTPENMASGNYIWPFTTVASCFFDPNLSYRGGPAAG